MVQKQLQAALAMEKQQRLAVEAQLQAQEEKARVQEAQLQEQLRAQEEKARVQEAQIQEQRQKLEIIEKWKNARPPGVNCPSSKKSDVLEEAQSQLKEGSPTLHPSFMAAMRVCLAVVPVPLGITSASNLVYEQLQRFTIPERSGYFHDPPNGEAARTSWLSGICSYAFPTYDSHPVLWCHQMPDKKGAKVDIISYCSQSMTNSDLQPSPALPFAIFEIGFEGSKLAQALSYALNGALVLSSPSQVIFSVDLLIRTRQIVLHGFAMPQDEEAGFLWHTVLWKTPLNRQSLARIFYVILEYGHKHNIEYADEFPLLPWVRLGPHCSIDIKSDCILKCYDYRYSDKGEADKRRYQNFVKFLDAEVVLQNKRRNFTVISYPAIEGRHVADSVSQFRALIRNLVRIHEQGLGHGDIRASNVVFGANGLGRFIDFDFSGAVGEATYPVGYNCDIHDGKRHHDAVGGAFLAYEHDWYALGALMINYACPYNETEWNAATELIRKGKPNRALKRLQAISDKALKPITTFEKIFGTGSIILEK